MVIAYAERPSATIWPGVREILGGAGVGVAVAVAVGVGVVVAVGVGVAVGGTADGVAVGVALIMMMGCPPEPEHPATAAANKPRAMNLISVSDGLQARIRQILLRSTGSAAKRFAGVKRRYLWFRIGQIGTSLIPCQRRIPMDNRQRHDR